MEACQSSVVEEGNHFFCFTLQLVFYKFHHRGYNLLEVNASTRTILVTICSEGYFKVHFLFGDYFGDYFQFGIYFLNK